MSTATETIQISPELRDFEELVRKVDSYFVRGTKGKHLFGSASKREEYYHARVEISKFEQGLLNNRHTNKNISSARLDSYLMMLDNLREQVRKNYEQHLGGSLI